MNWMQYMANPQALAIKKYMFEILQDKYADHDQLIERVAHSLTTGRDVEGFGTLIAAIYECGYLKAVNDYKDSLTKMGLKVTVVPEAKN